MHILFYILVFEMRQTHRNKYSIVYSQQTGKRYNVTIQSSTWTFGVELQQIHSNNLRNFNNASVTFYHYYTFIYFFVGNFEIIVPIIIHFVIDTNRGLLLLCILLLWREYFRERHTHTEHNLFCLLNASLVCSKYVVS